MFRFLIVVLALVGLVSVLGGALGTAAAGVGALFLVPVLLFKLFFILMIVGFIGRRAWGHDGGPRRPARDASPRNEDRFEDWHRMAHAREEVDSWVDGLPNDTI